MDSLGHVRQGGAREDAIRDGVGPPSGQDLLEKGESFLVPELVFDEMLEVETDLLTGEFVEFRVRVLGQMARSEGELGVVVDGVGLVVVGRRDFLHVARGAVGDGADLAAAVVHLRRLHLLDNFGEGERGLRSEGGCCR